MNIDAHREISRLGLTPSRSVHLNKTSGADKLPTLTWADIALATSCNRHDMQLYRFALQLRQLQLDTGRIGIRRNLLEKILSKKPGYRSHGRFGFIKSGMATGWIVPECAHRPRYSTVRT